jgi:hypothetical protein
MTNFWPLNALVQKHDPTVLVGAKSEQDEYLKSVVWTQVEPVYASNLAQEISTDIATLKTWAERNSDLAKIRTLQVDWDGYESAPPDFGVWQRALIFLHVLRKTAPANPPKKMAVSPDGQIAMEWLEGRSLIRAEVGESDEVEWMIAVPGQPAEFITETVAELSASPEQVYEWQRTPTVVDEHAFAAGR